MASRTYRRAVELMEADLGDEMIALDDKAGTCFGFNPVAMKVWRCLSRPRSFDELREKLLASYDVTAEQCTRELAELLDEMTTVGLIDEVP